jgi:hypothetical protein
MSNKHTPGPWARGTLGDGGRVNVYADDTMNLRICRVDSGQDIGMDAMSNARLIAAAPELLEALKWAVNFLEDNFSESDMPELRKLRAARDKAAPGTHEDYGQDGNWQSPGASVAKAVQ